MARDFDISNPDYIDFGNPSELNITGDEITLSIWVCRKSNSAEMKIFAKWADAGGQFSYLLSKDSSNRMLFALFNGGTNIANSTTVLVVNVWYHIAGVYDGTEIRIYVNGVEEGSNGVSGNINSSTAPVRLGVGSGATSENPLDGFLGHAALWDVALSADEVAALGVGISPLQIPDGLVCYAPLNGQSPEPNLVGTAIGTVNGTTVTDEPPIPNSIKAP